MFRRWIAPLTAPLLGLLLLGAGGALLWQRLQPAAEVAPGPEPAAPVPARQTVVLSESAQQNLKLTCKPLTPQTYWKVQALPGTIIDRPAHSDRGVVAPMAGVVTRVYRVAGDLVQPGEPLLRFKLLSETLQLTQTELYKATQEVRLVEQQRQRLEGSAGAVSESRRIEVENQLTRLGVGIKAYRQELQNRGLTPQQIQQIGEGQFVSEVDVVAPPHRESPSSAEPPALEVQELRVEVGQQVTAGQQLVLLADHRQLAIEGRAFQGELPAIERAVRERWPVEVEFLEAPAGDWPGPPGPLAIRHIGNTIDPLSRTFSFLIPLENPYRIVEREGGSRLFLWRFRPGQRVRLGVRQERLDDVFVVPREAVVRDGGDAFVFRQNGDAFDRKPVRVLHEDRDRVVLANDGSVPPGLYVAHSAAAQLQRILKSDAGALPKGFHIHADGSVHMGEH